MKLNHLTNILALASCAFILWGCPKTPEQEDPKISANPATVIFENTASTQTVTVAANRAWTVSVGGVDWLTANPASKSGDTQESTTVTLTAKANDGALREATVTFKTATISATVKVTQKAAAGTEVTYTAIKKLWETYKDQVATSGASVSLPVGVNVKARVISNISDGNCNNKSMYVEDAVDPYSGICIRFSSADKNVIPQGAEVAINMDGGTISNYNGTVQLTPASDDNIVRTATAVAVQAPATVSALTSEILSKYQSMYIATPKVQVVESALKNTMAGSVTVQDEAGETVVMYSGTSSSQTASWGSESVPQGSGILSGIFVPYGSTLEIIPQTKADWSGLTGARFTVAQGEATLVSIASVRNAASGSISDNNKIRGIVTSSAKNKVNSSKTVFMQDATSAKSGIMIYVASASDNTFEPGDEIEVKLKGASKTVYNGSDEIAISDDGNITRTATPNAAVNPVSITVDQLKNENANWQSMYVVLSDSVQVVKDSLNKMMTGNVIMETSKGTQFASYTRAGSAWADMKVPQGAGKLKGVASIYQGKTGDPVYQVIPQVESDWNTLTGARFGSATPGGAVKKTIAQARDLLKPATDKDTVTVIDDIYVIGTVVTDISQNFANKGFCIEDGDAAHSGLYFYNPAAALTDVVNIGDEVKVSLKGCKAIMYNGMIEVLTPSADVISKTGTANAVKAPVAVTVAQFESGAYESMYVQLEGVFQVVEKQIAQKMYDATAKNNGNIYCETASKDTVDMYNTKYAAWKDNIVPQGSGSLCGVATAYKGIWQVQPQSSADFSGMTGTRFVPGGSTGPAVGTVLLEENFDWIKDMYCGDANHRSTVASGDTLLYYSKYGWPTVKVNGANYNEYSFNNDTINARPRFYQSFPSFYKVYARAEGWVKIGDGSNRGWLKTIPLAGIGDATADVLVSFDAALYANTYEKTDDGDENHALQVYALNGGSINGGSSMDIEVSKYYGFTHYGVIVNDATANTVIAIGDTLQTAVAERYYIDNVKIEVVAKGSSAPSPSDVTLPADGDVQVINNAGIAAAGGSNQFFIRVNRPWKIYTNCDWLQVGNFMYKDGINSLGSYTVNQFFDNEKSYGAVNGSSIQYVVSLIAGTNNTSSARSTGVTVVSDDGAYNKSFTVSQAAGSADLASISDFCNDIAFSSSDGSGYYIYPFEVNGIDYYTGIKMGTSKLAGTIYTSPLGFTGAATLTFYAAGWAKVDPTIEITVIGGGQINGGSSVQQALKANATVTGNQPYAGLTLSDSEKYTFALTGITESTTLKISSDITANKATAARFVAAGFQLTR